MNENGAAAFLSDLLERPGDLWAESFGLSRIEALLERLGCPQDGLRFVHVGGTAGKGSTATILASILQSSGYRTGLHVSPHIIDPGERAQINGVPASSERLAELAAKVQAAMDEVHIRPSFFEALWAIALLEFADQQTEINVIEVGLGGRLDATNVVPSDHQILTNIGLDHVAILGPTKAAILRDKQEIVDPGSVVVSAISEPHLRKALVAHVENRNSEVRFLGKDFRSRLRHELHDVQGLPQGSVFDYYDSHGALRNLHLPIAGRIQLQNAALAIATARSLAMDFPQITGDSIAAGVESVRLHGRFQTVERDPFVILDGAHNPDKIKALVDDVKSALPDDRFITVFRYKERPDIWESIRSLSEISDHIVLTDSTALGDMGREAGYDEAAAERALREFGATACRSPNDAIAEAKMRAKDTGARGVIVTGSIYMLQELLLSRQRRD